MKALDAQYLFGLPVLLLLCRVTAEGNKNTRTTISAVDGNNVTGDMTTSSGGGQEEATTIITSTLDVVALEDHNEFMFDGEEEVNWYNQNDEVVEGELSTLREEEATEGVAAAEEEAPQDLLAAEILAEASAIQDGGENDQMVSEKEEDQKATKNSTLAIMKDRKVVKKTTFVIIDYKDDEDDYQQQSTEAPSEEQTTEAPSEEQNDKEQGEVNQNKDQGNADCPCIDSTSIFSNDFPPCVLDGGIPGALINNGDCLPLSFGALECRDWDMIKPSCGQRGRNAPAYCQDKWCYVDPDKCHLSSEHYYKGIVGLYYSYSTCGYDERNWLLSETTDVLTNRQLVAAVPGILWPINYKREEDGKVIEPGSLEAYDPSVPWEGYMIDYFNAVVGFSNMKNVTYKHRSKGSENKGYQGSFTQAVTDVKAGIVDVAVSSFWVTSQRLELTPFTTPFGSDHFGLWIEYHDHDRPDEDSSWNYIGKIGQPFSSDLWMTLACAVVIYGLMSVWVSPQVYRTFDEPAKTIRDKAKRTFVVFMNAFTVSALDFLGGAVDGRQPANIAQKFLNIGFATIIFISVSSYTANLAAFLTVQAKYEHVSSIEQAVAHNMAICAPYVYEQELITLYPNARWVFRPEQKQVYEAYDDGDCKAFVDGWVEIRADPNAQNFFCDRGLVRVGNPIFDIPMAFPAGQEIVGGLSHYIVEAKNQGIHFENFAYQLDPVCELDMRKLLTEEEDEDSDLNQLTTKHFTGPLLVFVCSCLSALLWHLYHYRRVGGGCGRLVRRPTIVSGSDQGWDIASKNSEDEIATPPLRNSIGGKPFKKEALPDIQSRESAEEMMEELFAQQRALFDRMKQLPSSSPNQQSCQLTVSDLSQSTIETKPIKPDPPHRSSSL